MGESRTVVARKASPWDTVKAVSAAFFGVRGRGAHERDLSKLNPLHLILTGVVLAAVFVLTLVLIVRSVLA